MEAFLVLVGIAAGVLIFGSGIKMGVEIIEYVSKNNKNNNVEE